MWPFEIQQLRIQLPSHRARLPLVYCCWCQVWAMHIHLGYLLWYHYLVCSVPCTDYGLRITESHVLRRIP